MAAEGFVTPLRQRRPRLRLDPGSYRRLHREVLERDAWRCQGCGGLSNLQVHHLVPRSLLGDDAPKNLITLCAACHARAHNPEGHVR